MHTHVLGQGFHDVGRLVVGWHQGQVMCPDDLPTHKPTLVKDKHAVDAAPQG